MFYMGVFKLRGLGVGCCRVVFREYMVIWYMTFKALEGFQQEVYKGGVGFGIFHVGASLGAWDGLRIRA